MNELKKILIQQILETKDDRLLKMLYDIIKLDKEQSEPSHPLETDSSNPRELNSSEIQDSIDFFFNPSSFQKP